MPLPLASVHFSRSRGCGRISEDTLHPLPAGTSTLPCHSLLQDFPSLPRLKPERHRQVRALWLLASRQMSEQPPGFPYWSFSQAWLRTADRMESCQDPSGSLCPEGFLKSDHTPCYWGLCAYCPILGFGSHWTGIPPPLHDLVSRLSWVGTSVLRGKSASAACGQVILLYAGKGTDQQEAVWGQVALLGQKVQTGEAKEPG
jgi:hypothetical protein